MEDFKKLCIALRKKGYSIIEIMKVTGRAKSSIYTHIKDIPLSAERLSDIRKASGKRIRKFAIARKGKSARPFRIFNTWEPEKVLLIGHLLFDGELVHEGCRYNNRSEALIERVQLLMKELYDFEPKRFKNMDTGVDRISYYNVALGIFLRKKAKCLLIEVRKLPLECKRAFLRAFFDDEGCIDYRPKRNKRSVRGYQKDTKILKLVQILLLDLNIKSRVVKPNEVIIVGKENLIRFEQEINFSQGIYMNGNRTNSRWKKHIEKRQLLRTAIESFKT